MYLSPWSFFSHLISSSLLVLLRLLPLLISATILLGWQSEYKGHVFEEEKVFFISDLPHPSRTFLSLFTHTPLRTH